MRAEVALALASTTDLYAADDVLVAAGLMHAGWYPAGGEDLDEAQLACGFFAPLLSRQDIRIPRPMREILTGFRDEAAGDGGDRAHPRAAIRRVLRCGTPDDGAWADLLEQMSVICHAQYQRTGDLAAEYEALALLGHATATTPEGERLRIDRAARFGRRAWALGRSTRDQNLLETAVDGLRKVAERVDHPDRAQFLLDLSVALLDLYRQTGDGAVLDEMLAVDRRAVEESAPGEPLVACLTNLGVGLLTEYTDRGRVDALDEACVHLRRADKLAPAHWERLPYLLTALGSALRRVHHDTGDSGALEEAVEVLRRAVELQPDDDPNRAGRMANLALSLTAWNERVPNASALAEAEDLLRRAEEVTALTRGEAATGARPADHASVVLGGLAEASEARYRDTGDISDLDSAIEYAERAVEAAAGPADRRPAAANAGGLLIRRHQVARDSGEPTGDFLERAERHLAEDVGQMSARVAANLGAVMGLRHEQSENTADSAAAVALCQRAAADPSAPPSIRAEAAAAGGRVAAAGQDWAGAMGDFAAAIALLEQAVPRSLRRDDGEYRLERLRGLAGDAAACALWCSAAGHAVELLEQGRGVLLAQTMDIRTDLTRLGERDKDLADELDSLRHALDDPVVQRS